MKRITALSAAAVLLAASVPATAAAADAEVKTAKVGGVTYSYTAGDKTGITITGVSAAEGELTIPGTISKQTVIAVGDMALLGQTELEKVTLPDSLESIGQSAFAGCSALTELDIPDSVKTIGSSAFMGCYGLTSVTVGKGVTEIPDDCFFSCPSLTEVTLPAKLKSIGSEAFFGCPDVELTIPETVTAIGSFAIGWQSDAHSSSIRYIDGFLLYGKTGSYAEEYAENNGIDFLDPDNYLSGDVNGDTKVDAKDASSVLAEYAKASTGGVLTFSKKQRIVGDMEPDGAINAKDASRILVEYARLSTQ